jgi:hypothetical protein
MSYCGQGLGYSGTCTGTCQGFYKLRLSANDIASLQHAYGRRIPGQIVSRNGNCLAANGYHHGNDPGPYPFMYSCDEYADDQQFKWDSSNRSLWSYLSSDPNYKACFDGSGIQSLQLDDCTGVAQGISFTNVEIRGFGAKCMTLAGGASAPDGSVITISDCRSMQTPATYDATQRWDIGGSGEIRLAGTQRCATTAVGAPNNAYLTIYNCSYPNQQQFRFFYGGYIQSTGYTAACLDAQGPNDSQYLTGQYGPGEGAPVQSYSCLSGTPNQNLNQKWNFSGPIRLDSSGLVFDRQWNQDFNNSTVWAYNAYQPTTNTAQEWDYYFE